MKIKRKNRVRFARMGSVGDSLKPCAFCQGDARVDTLRCAVDCTLCGITTGVRASVGTALTIWSTRVNTEEVCSGRPNGDGPLP